MLALTFMGILLFGKSESIHSEAAIIAVFGQKLFLLFKDVF